MFIKPKEDSGVATVSLSPYLDDYSFGFYILKCKEF